MDLPKYKREYCCTECGLIWFEETTLANETTCIECGNNNKEGLIYACDSMGFAYAHEWILEKLKEEGKSIHYSIEHPKYKE